MSRLPSSTPLPVPGDDPMSQPGRWTWIPCTFDQRREILANSGGRPGVPVNGVQIGPFNVGGVVHETRDPRLRVMSLFLDARAPDSGGTDLYFIVRRL